MTSSSGRILISFIPALVIAGVLGLARQIELAFFPVVTGFSVHSVSRDNNIVRIKGTLTKARECRFVEVDAASVFEGGQMEDAQHLPIRFLDGEGSDKRNRDIGRQAFGPWLITLPVKPETVAIKLTSEHRCHPLWAQSTELSIVPLLYEIKK